MRATVGTTIALLCAAAAGLGAQTALAQLGLTETAARNFVLEELWRPAGGRRSEIAVAGTRAFLKLPASARGVAATGLFAWARSYVNSPAFTTAYATYRREAIPVTNQDERSVEQTVKDNIDRQLDDLKQARQALASLSPQDRAVILEQLEEQEKRLKDPQFIRQMQTQLAEERAQKHGAEAALTTALQERIPADPKVLFARRLRQFLDATADVNFSTRTISLTGGPDGIEFLDPAVRTRPWMWLEAAIVGPEATAAARAAAQAWLKEIE